MGSGSCRHATSSFRPAQCVFTSCSFGLTFAVLLVWSRFSTELEPFRFQCILLAGQPEILVGVVCGAQSQLAGSIGFPAGVAVAAVAPRLEQRGLSIEVWQAPVEHRHLPDFVVLVSLTQHLPQHCQNKPSRRLHFAAPGF